MKVRAIGRFELVAAVALGRDVGAWTVVAADDPSDEARLIAEELRSIVNEPVHVVILKTAGDLVGESTALVAEPVIFAVPPEAGPLLLDEWRSRLSRDAAAVLIVSRSRLARLPDTNPHFMSWIGPSVHQVEEDRYLSDEAKAERLNALRAHFGMSDTEVVDLVEAGGGPFDAEIAEWLVLIGRADLLDHE